MVTAAADKASYPIIKSIPDGDAFWDYALVEPAEKRLYLSREDGVTVIDLATDKVTERFVAGKQDHAIVALSRGRARGDQRGERHGDHLRAQDRQSPCHHRHRQEAGRRYRWTRPPASC